MELFVIKRKVSGRGKLRPDLWVFRDKKQATKWLNFIID
ncbi:hypothetical protein AsAng_0019710 [Aureispira anguillae]|uniref:Uncharacterized protein n=1 Tax=Aureispira anguillae TaxID=2864201 RepID=A0A916DQM6_9BACT|nr:hypothetical protein AsAng_0019710 [Aureispira anguillae]